MDGYEEAASPAIFSDESVLAQLPSESKALRALIERIVRCDQAALAEIYAITGSQVHRVALRVLGSAECAQEIVCDVFIYVWQHANEYDAARGPVRAWLHVATRHRSIDRLRGQRKHALLRDRLPHVAQSIESIHPETLLIQLEADLKVRAAMNGLSPLRRELISLSFFQGLSHEAISVKLGLPLGTVKSHVKRALGCMRGVLTH